MKSLERALGVRIRRLRVRRLQLASPGGLVPLREIAHHVLALVPLAALDRHVATHVADRRAESLRPIEHHQPRLVEREAPLPHLAPVRDAAPLARPANGGWGRSCGPRGVMASRKFFHGGAVSPILHRHSMSPLERDGAAVHFCGSADRGTINILGRQVSRGCVVRISGLGQRISINPGTGAGTSPQPCESRVGQSRRSEPH